MRIYGNARCSVPGCTRHASNLSPLCWTHKSTKARWGHPRQAPMSKGELSKAMRHVEKLIDTRPNAEALWAKLTAALDTVKAEANAVMAEARAKRVALGSKLDFAQLISTVLSEVDARTVILAMVAVGYIAADDRHRFKSDEAFFLTAGRRFHLLASVNRVGYLNATTGKRHMTPKEPRREAALNVGRLLMSTFGPFGIRLHELERITERRTEEARKAPLYELVV